MLSGSPKYQTEEGRRPGGKIRGESPRVEPKDTQHVFLRGNAIFDQLGSRCRQAGASVQSEAQITSRENQST